MTANYSQVRSSWQIQQIQTVRVPLKKQQLINVKYNDYLSTEVFSGIIVYDRPFFKSCYLYTLLTHSFSVSVCDLNVIKHLNKFASWYEDPFISFTISDYIPELVFFLIVQIVLRMFILIT